MTGKGSLLVDSSNVRVIIVAEDVNISLFNAASVGVGVAAVDSIPSALKETPEAFPKGFSDIFSLVVTVACKKGKIIVTERNVVVSTGTRRCF